MRRALPILSFALLLGAGSRLPAQTATPPTASPSRAQKGFGLLTFRARPVAEPRAGKWRIAKMSGGSGPSIIAERGEALLERTGTARERSGAFVELTRLAGQWMKDHPPAKLKVGFKGDLLELTAEGRRGDSSAPASGHNALGDLTAFLSTLDLRLDSWGALAAFTGIAVGTETDGKSLGIAHRDAMTGELTANLASLREEQGTPIAEITLRLPRGVTREQIESRLADRSAAFAQRSGATVAAEVTRLDETAAP